MKVGIEGLVIVAWHVDAGFLGLVLGGAWGRHLFVVTEL